MGLSWTKPQKVKDNTLILTKARIPEKGQGASEEIWTIWRTKKEEVKKDGFGLSKDKYYGGAWYVTYFHEIDSESLKKPEGGGGKMSWRIEFDEKVDKYKKIVENLSSALGSKDKDSDLPRDNRRVQPRRKKGGPGAGNNDQGDGNDDDLTGGGPSGYSDTSVDAEQLALEIADLDFDLDLV